MSVTKESIESGLVKLIQEKGWTIYEDEQKNNLWSISAVKKDGELLCIEQESRLEALQNLAGYSVDPETQSSNLTINFKRLHDEAVIPTYAKSGDAGMDVTAVGVTITDNFIEYDLGFSIAIPQGYMALLFPRSSISKYDLELCNSVGVIDSGYRGPMIARFNPIKFGGKIYAIGDRVAQLIVLPFPTITYKEVEELDETERGTGGYGSTGV